MSQELLDAIHGLEAALHIAREGERIAKERLSAVSEELVAAHQENDGLRNQISSLQESLEEWKLDFEYLDKEDYGLDGEHQ